MGLTTTLPASWPISQQTLRKWERSARVSTFICNQAASFSRCLTGVQENMAPQLKIIKDEKAKGKSSVKAQEATEELTYLRNFNQSITFAMWQDNAGLIRLSVYMDSYLDNAIHNAEDKMAQYDDRHKPGVSHKKSGQYQPYALTLRSTQDTGRKSGQPAWKTLSCHSQKGSWQGLRLLITMGQGSVFL